MDNLKKVIEGICVGKEDSAAGSLKVQLYIINNSNPCRAQFSYDELESLREFCEQKEVREVKFIEPSKDVTYIVVVYRDSSLEETKMYAVFHKYDVDGGFGDAIEREDLIRVFDTKEEADAFKKKYEKPHVYDTPYCELWCGTLEVRELPIFSHEDDFWWLKGEQNV